MSRLTADEVRALLQPYHALPLPAAAYDRVVRYLAVFALWSTRMNLSTIVEPEQVVQRHFGEGLAMAEALPPFQTLLDLGSGAGFPGLPIATAFPEAEVMLAESQKKKAGFLREAAWMMGLSVNVWADRAERLPPDRKFDVVTLRAVDQMSAALQAGLHLLRAGGTLAFFVGENDLLQLPQADWASIRTVDVPQSPGRMVLAELGR